MTRLRALWRNFRHRARVDRDLNEELASYLELLTDEQRAKGLDEAAARRAARVQVGGLQQVKEAVRSSRSGARIETLWLDVRFGLRLLRRTPSYAVAAIVSLALGIGANTAVFGLLNALRLRSLPVPAASELAAVSLEGPRCCRHTGRNRQVSVPLWREIERQQQAFSRLFAFADTRFNLAPYGEVRYVEGLFVSGDFFPALGVPAMLGRTLTRDDDQPGCGSPPVVISHALWQREFGGNPDVLNRTIGLRPRQHPIAGVMPPDFFGVEVGRRFDVAMPMCASGFDRHDHWWLAVMGRLKPGWTVEQANAHFAALGPSLLAAATPPSYEADQAKQFVTLRFSVRSAANGVSPLRAQYEEPLWLLFAIAALVLLTACANVASLALVRATAREGELALRFALGATQLRVVRQLAVEGVLVALAGAAGGLAIARAAQQAVMAALSTPTDPIVLDVAPDWRVLVFTTLIVLLTAFAFAAASAGRAARARTAITGARTTAGVGRVVAREALLGVQVAMSVVLVSAAMLFVITVRNLSTLDAGFTREGVLVANVFLNDRDHPPATRAALQQELSARLAAIPGVAGAAHATVPPLSGSSWGIIARVPRVDGEFRAEANRNQISDRYFLVMGIRLVAGREFGPQDSPASPKVAVVNESFARTFFEGRSPLGERYLDGRDEFQIVGLVADTKLYSLREEFRPIAYTAASQVVEPPPTIRFVLRSELAMGPLMESVRRQLAAVSPSAGVRFAPLASMADNSMLGERLLAGLSGFFGLIALSLAAVGVYGTVAYTAASRQREIGIRLALGARAGDVIHAVLGRVTLAGGIGLMLGGGLAFAASATARSFLYGVEPTDPAVVSLILAVIVTSAAVAAALPARRALRTDPVAALKSE